MATPAFLSAWLPSGRDVAHLIKVELVDPTPLTLFLSTREVNTQVSNRQTFVFRDDRGASTQIYAQNLDSVGTERWTTNGVQLSNSQGAARHLTSAACPDGVGGTFVAYLDRRNGAATYLYAQRLTSAGVPVAGWPAGGVLLCDQSDLEAAVGAGYDSIVTMCSDGAGGFVVVWGDSRGATPNDRLYVQRVNSAGVPQWTANGVLVYNGAGNRVAGNATPVLSGGVFLLMWTQATSIVTKYQVVNAAGALVGAVGTLASSSNLNIIADGSGNFLIGYTDGTGTAEWVRKISAAGATVWSTSAAGGVGSTYPPFLVSDGLGGCFMVFRGTTVARAQHLDSSGTLLWGAPVILAFGGSLPYFFFGTSDGAGGAIFVWPDFNTHNMTAQRIDASGNVLWGANGVVFSTGGSPYGTAVTSDGTGGAYSFYTLAGDVKCAHILADGTVQWIVSVTNATGTQAGSSAVITGTGAAPQNWRPALGDLSEIIQSGTFCDSNPALASCDFHVLPVRHAGQPDGDTLVDLFFQYIWAGAVVTIYQWELGMTDFTDANVVLNKGVVLDFKLENAGVRVWCQQRTDWVVQLPRQEVNKQDHPRAPEKSYGTPIPIVLGDGRTTPARAPAAEYGAFNQTVAGVGGIRCSAIRGVVARLGEGGAGGQKGRVLFAGHACNLFNSDVAGSTPAIEVGDRMCEIDPVVANVFSSAVIGTGFDMEDITAANIQPFDAFYPIYPLDSQQVASNPAGNPRAATDLWGEFTYADLDYDAGKRDLMIPLPDVPSQGLYLSARAVVGWSTSPGAANLRMDYVNPTGGGHTASLAATANLDTPTGAGSTISSGKPTADWNFGNNGCYMHIYWTGVATGQKARIYFAGATVKFRPNWPVVTTSDIVNLPGYITPQWNIPWQEALYTGRLNRVNSTFHACLQGHADDGSGTYTGVAGALVKLPPDQVHLLLDKYCDQTLFETTPGVAGSLVDLRADLADWRGGQIESFVGIDEFRQSSEVLREVARDNLLWFFISRFTNKWNGVAWRAGRPVNFPRRLTRWDVGSPTGPELITHRDDVINNLVLEYGYDSWQRRTVHSTSLGFERSAAGYAFRGIRDERTELVANESDRIDFTDSGGTRVANLTAGAYLPMALAQHVSAQMSAVHVRGLVMVAWGFEIVAGYNDKFDINDGAAKTATLNAGSYTGATLAVEVARALNAVSTNWSCSYSALTRQFTIARSAGTNQFKCASGANVAKTCCVTLGFVISDRSPGPFVSDFTVESERYVLAALNDNLVLKFETGTNGIGAVTPRAAGMPLGFDMGRDYDGQVTYAIAHSPKNNREVRCVTSRRRYGARPPMAKTCRTVRRTEAARELRNRWIALYGAPPVEIRFPSERVPDLGIGMTFDFDASLDAVTPYAVPDSDGSWLGKVFVAVHTAQHCYPTVQQDVIAFALPSS